VDNIPNYKCVLSEQIWRSFNSKVGHLHREAPMRKLSISVAALQFVLSAATAQPATTSTATQSASLDQRGNVSKILANRTAKPLVHLEIVVASESAVVLPLVALHLLPPHLIAGAASESGIASIYAGGMTASGEQTRIGGMTAAHRSIPFGTKVRVTNRANGKSAVVRINDRGPFFGGRIIDLMPATAKALGFSGLTPVTLVVVEAAER
jgi:peptidoglycan lytic transglycosylase